MSAAPAIVDGILQIVGTKRADDVAVVIGRNGRVHAVVNGKTTQFRLGKVHGVVVDAGAGSDKVTVSLDAPATLAGGAGDDVLVGGAGDDLLSGGKGTDRLDGRAGSNRTEGGETASPAQAPIFDTTQTVSVTSLVPGLLGATPAVEAPQADDATLEGSVNFDDLLRLAANYNTSGTAWNADDFNDDGSVSFDDLLALAANYNMTLTGSFSGDWQLAQQS